MFNSLSSFPWWQPLPLEEWIFEMLCNTRSVVPSHVMAIVRVGFHCRKFPTNKLSWIIISIVPMLPLRGGSL